MSEEYVKYGSYINRVNGEIVMIMEILTDKDGNIEGFGLEDSSKLAWEHEEESMWYATKGYFDYWYVKTSDKGL